MQIDQKMKILLAEDGTTMRKMEVKILQQIGYENIIEAVDGVQAMERLAANDDVNWSFPTGICPTNPAWMSSPVCGKTRPTKIPDF